MHCQAQAAPVSDVELSAYRAHKKHHWNTTKQSDSLMQRLVSNSSLGAGCSSRVSLPQREVSHSHRAVRALLHLLAL